MTARPLLASVASALPTHGAPTVCRGARVGRRAGSPTPDSPNVGGGAADGVVSNPSPGDEDGTSAAVQREIHQRAQLSVRPTLRPQGLSEGVAGCRRTRATRLVRTTGCTWGDIAADDFTVGMSH